MTVKIYDKLVRDNIPNILKQAGSKFKVVKATDDQILTYTTKKLIEEVQELIDAMLSNPDGVDQILGECADIYSVLIKLASIYDIDEVDILEFEETKTEANGGFDEEYILKWIDEKIEPEEYINEEFTIPNPKAKKKPAKSVKSESKKPPKKKPPTKDK